HRVGTILRSDRPMARCCSDRIVVRDADCRHQRIRRGYYLACGRDRPAPGTQFIVSVTTFFRRYAYDVLQADYETIARHKYPRKGFTVAEAGLSIATGRSLPRVGR